MKLQSAITEIDNSQLQRCYDPDATEKDLEALFSRMRPHLLQVFRARGVTGEELEDLCAEAVARLLAALRRGQAHHGPRMLDAVGYARIVARNVFIDHIQEGRSRRQWKRRLIDLLDGKWGGKQFARWQIRLDWLGGYAAWRGQPFRATERYRMFCDDRQTFCDEALKRQDPMQVPLPDLLAHLFGWIKTPIEVGELSRHLSSMQRLCDVVTVSVEELAVEGDRDYNDLLPPACDDVEAYVMDTITSDQLRTQLWQQIVSLPPRQRTALLLAMERDQLLLLAETGANVSAALDLPYSLFAPIWAELPLSNPAIAVRLGASQQQVSNLRKCARERIARCLVKLQREEASGGI